MSDTNNNIDNSDSNDISNSGTFVAPRPILEMYQKISFSSFKLWASILSDISVKDYSDKDQYIPLSSIWNALDARLSHKRLEVLLEELQTTLIKKHEFLPQTQELKIASFSLLGPTEITTNNASDVTSLKYRLVSELLQILKTESGKEKFIIETRTFTSLKGAGGNYAKNLLLLCTPYIPVGETRYYTLNELREYMNLSNSFLDKKGNTEYKTFNRDVLKKAYTSLEENPYVNFQITAIKVKKESGRVNQIKFILEERRSINTLLVDKVNKHSSPAEPARLKSMLISFWKEQTMHGPLSYSKDILKKLLMQFKLVDKYIEEIIDHEKYISHPMAETFRLFSISTAIYQLWLDGKLKKEDSKIYNYANSIFRTPDYPKIDSLCQKFLIDTGIQAHLPEDKIKQEKKKAVEKRIARAKLVLSKIKLFERQQFKVGLESCTEDEIIELDKQFVSLATKGKGHFGPWIKKIIQQSDTNEGPLLDLLTKRTLETYKLWLKEQLEEKGHMPQRNLKGFLNRYTQLSRHLAFLNVPHEISIDDLTAMMNNIVE